MMDFSGVGRNSKLCSEHILLNKLAKETDIWPSVWEIEITRYKNSINA